MKLSNSALESRFTVPLFREGFGFKSTNILSGEDYQFACYTYVDDTDLIHIGDNQTEPQHVFDEMQREQQVEH